MSEATSDEPMSVEVEFVDGVSIVRVSGELDLDTEPDLQRAFDGAGLGPTSIVEVDLSGLTFIDSTGLRFLVQRAPRVARLVLVDPTPQVERVLHISGLDRVLEVRGPAVTSTGEHETAQAVG